VQKKDRVLSSRFMAARPGSVERWYPSCTDNGKPFLPLDLPSSDGARLAEAVF